MTKRHLKCRRQESNAGHIGERLEHGSMDACVCGCVRVCGGVGECLGVRACMCAWVRACTTSLTSRISMQSGYGSQLFFFQHFNLISLKLSMDISIVKAGQIHLTISAGLRLNMLCSVGRKHHLQEYSSQHWNYKLLVQEWRKCPHASVPVRPDRLRTYMYFVWCSSCQSPTMAHMSKK